MQAPTSRRPQARPALLFSRRVQTAHAAAAWLGRGFLFSVTSLSLLAILFLFLFIARDALPFFRLRGFAEFFTSTNWYPSGEPAEFGTLAIFVGSGLVALGAAVIAVPLGIAAAMCLSDVLPFSLRQVVKPVIEILAAIPSVAYGFFALVVLAPLMQREGGHLLAAGAWLFGLPLLGLAVLVGSDLATAGVPGRRRDTWRAALALSMAAAGLYGLAAGAGALAALPIRSGTNALNVSIILGIMALPTIISVSEDALQAAGRELREGSYAMGATRAETMLRVILPAAGSGIAAAVLLGLMRAIGETMVVWMASGNAARIPTPWFDLRQPVRTLTATIAGDMGEADQVTGSERFHVLFAMALCLLVICFVGNLASEAIVRRSARKLGG